MRSLFVTLLLVGTVMVGACGDDSPQNPKPDAGPGIDTMPPDGMGSGSGDMVCETLAPLPSGTCEVTAGGEAKLIKGNILTPTGVLIGGQVAVNDAGQITCTGCDCAHGGETVISCPGATVSPGLINAHDHITYTQNAPYTDTGERYEDRQQWRKGGSSFEGHTKIPAPGGATPAQQQFGELRFLMGGATSTVGSGGAKGLLRNLDKSNLLEGLTTRAVNFETFPLDDDGGGRRDGDCNYGSGAITAMAIASDTSFEPHTSEGIDRYAHNEFKCQSSSTFDTVVPGLSQNLLVPQTAMIHAIGVTANDYGAMAQAGTALIWSPRSNVTLYGDTARVTTAAALGVQIALGTDWTPTGSINMLRELRCADSLNKTYMNGYFSDKKLWEMVTLNAAAVTATDSVIGMLAPNHVADISIFKANGRDPYRAIIDADPQDVALVMRGGTVLYGDDATVNSLGTNCDTLDVCGTQKRVCLQSEITMTLAQLQAAVGNIYPAFSCTTPTNEPSCTPKRPVSVAGSTVYTGMTSITDSDGDGIANTSDNCPNVFNPVRPMDSGVQPDADGDGTGDACDVCPLDANTTTCTAVDPDDQDHDGIPNSSDNCPDVANPGQSDADGDGKGDACDACALPNPGNQGCPSTIYAVKMGMDPDGKVVRIADALVTGKGSNGFFIQAKPGDTGYMGVDFSGMFVFTSNNATLLANAVVGQRVTIDATVATFQGQKELDTVTSVTATTTTVEALPAPVTATYAEIKTGGSRAAALEGVIVQVGTGSVTARDTAQNEFTLTSGTDSLSVDDFLTTFTLPDVGTVYSQVTGVVALRGMAMRLLPRSAADLVLGPPVLASFGPALSFTRVGTAGAATIPSTGALTVTLSSAAQGDTDVTITSSDSGALTVVGGKVTVPNGMTSATVLVNGLAQATDVTLTAQLGSGTPLTAHVRVLGSTEAPATVTLTPPTVSMTAGATTTLTATLDIPAPSGGTIVNVAVNPTNAGTVSPTLTFAADTLSQTFTFTDASMVASSMVTASLGASTSTSNITAAAVMRQLVISQIYGGGGNSGATLKNDYVELFNASNAPVSLQGKSVQYASTTGVFSTMLTFALPNATVPPGGYFLVQLAGGSNGTALPTPDAMGSTPNLSATAGKVALVDSTTPIASCTDATIIDFIGYGSGTNCSETALAPGGSNTMSLIRAGGGCTDSGNNANDFTAVAPMPRNSATTLAPCP